MILTVLGTAWVTGVVVAFLAFGLTLSVDGQLAWWFLGWILAGGVAATPFVLYGVIDER